MGNAVGVCERIAAGVADSRCSLVGVLPAGSLASGVEVQTSVPLHGNVGVGEGNLGVTKAISAGLPVSGGAFIPNKSWMISKPIAGTDTGISSTP